jgi:hypothetical protein
LRKISHTSPTCRRAERRRNSRRCVGLVSGRRHENRARPDLDAVSGGSAERSRGMEHPGVDGNGAQTFPVKGEPRRAVFTAVLRGRQARPELRVRRIRSDRRGRYDGKARTRQSVARRGPIWAWCRRRDRRAYHFARDPWINRQDVPDRIRLRGVRPPASSPRRRGRDRQKHRENEPKGARRPSHIRKFYCPTHVESTPHGFPNRTVAE